jgi:predicted nucleotidyltransferase
MKNLFNTRITLLVEEQIKKRMLQKYGYKRTVLFLIERLERKILQFILRSSSKEYYKKFKRKQKSGEYLGVDEYGRDVVFCLKEYAHLLIRKGVKLHTLIVLGSRAKGRGTPESDIDVMVIASNLPGVKTPEFTNLPQKIMNLKQRLLLSDFPLCIGVQPSACCSREEFLSWLKSFRVVALDAIYYGKVIYDDGFWEKALQLFKKLEKEYRLNETKIKEMLLVL